MLSEYAVKKAALFHFETGVLPRETCLLKSGTFSWVLEYIIVANDYKNAMIVFGATLKCHTI